MKNQASGFIHGLHISRCVMPISTPSRVKEKKKKKEPHEMYLEICETKTDR